jgi:hypothetical protein
MCAVFLRPENVSELNARHALLQNDTCDFSHLCRLVKRTQLTAAAIVGNAIDVDRLLKDGAYAGAKDARVRGK